MTCKICYHGIVIAKHKKNDLVYTFRCSCDLGASVVEKIPHWTLGLTNYYQIEKLEVTKEKMPVPYKEDEDEIPF